MSIAGINEDDLLMASGVAAAAMALLAVWHGLIVRDPASARLRNLAKIQNDLRAGVHVARRHRTRTDLRKSSLTLMQHAVDRLNLLRGRQAESIRARLARAGWRSKDAVTTYVFLRAVSPVVTVGGGLLFLGLRGQSLVNGVGLVVIGVGVVIGLFGADLLVKNRGDNRIKKLTMALPDALDLLVICAEAGLSLDSAIKRVGQEMKTASPEISDELMLTAIELSFLPDRQVALQNLISRTDVPKLRALVNSLIQSERYGTPLANSLRVLSAEFREERLVAAEEKAARLPAIMTIPMILFILPSLFIVIIGPAVLHVLDTLKGNATL
jgi:tight adherence protein C